MRVTMLFVTALAGGGCAALLHKVQGEEFRLNAACDEIHLEHTLTNQLCQVVRNHERFGEMDEPPMVAAGIQFLLDPHDLPGAYDAALVLDPDVMDRELAAAKVEELVAHRFASRVRETRTWAISEVDRQSPHWRDVLIKPGLAARASWKKGATRRAPWLAKAKALGGRVDAAAIADARDRTLLDEMITLHRAYVADCRRAGVTLDECLGDDVARPLTHRIVAEAERLGDEPLAQAEAIFFAAPDRSTIDRAARVAALEAEHDEQMEYVAWKQAHDEGRGEDAIRARWPVDPIDTHEIGAAGASGDGAQPSGATFFAQVARVERRGARAVVTFRRNVTMFTHSTGCHDTNRIDHVENGRVYYQDVCTGPDVTSPIDETPEPVTVPWNDARALHPMEVASFVLDAKRSGYVVRVRAGDAKMPTNLAGRDGDGAVLQLRDLRIDGDRPVAKASRKP